MALEKACWIKSRNVEVDVDLIKEEAKTKPTAIKPK